MTDFVQERFLELPDELERDFELTLTKWVSAGSDTKKIKVDSKEVTEDELKKIVESRKTDESLDKVAYAAFYCLNILYRNNLDMEQLSKLFNENESWCKNHATFTHLKTLKYLLTFNAMDIDEDSCLAAAYDLARNNMKNAGFSNAFADLYATLCEQSKENEEKYTKQWSKKAHTCIENAILQDPKYAKYYCIKGRILALDGKYEEADEYMQKAIALENSSRKDYAVRIGTYRYHRLLIQAKRRIDDVNLQQQIDSLKNAVTSNIETLAFFAGIVSFVVGSLSLAKGQTAFHAVVLIAVLMGALLFAFSVFDYMLHLNVKKIRIPNIVVAVISLMIVMGGIFLVR